MVRAHKIFKPALLEPEATVHAGQVSWLYVPVGAARSNTHFTFLQPYLHFSDQKTWICFCAAFTGHWFGPAGHTWPSTEQEPQVFICGSIRWFHVHFSLCTHFISLLFHHQLPLQTVSHPTAEPHLHLWTPPAGQLSTLHHQHMRLSTCCSHLTWWWDCWDCGSPKMGT